MSPISADSRREVEHAALRVLAEAESLDEAAPELLKSVSEALGWDYGALWVVDDERNRIRCVDVWCRDADVIEPFAKLSRETSFEKGVGLPGGVWASGDVTWIRDVVDHENFPRFAVAAEVGLHGAFGFPIFVRDECFGVMEFLDNEIQEPDRDFVTLLRSISAQVGGFIEWEQMEAELQFQKALLEYQSEAALDGIGVLSPEMRVLYWNHRILEIFGVQQEALEAGDAWPIILGLVNETADPQQMMDFAQTVLRDPDAAERIEVAMADGRTIDVWTAPVRGPDERLYGRVIYARDVTAQKRTEADALQANEWTNFLADATNLLTQELDVEAILNRLAELAVPRMADWCSVHLVDEGGILQQLATAHVDPAKVELARALQDRYPPDPNAEPSVYSAVRNREPVLMPEIPEELILQSAQDDEHLRMIKELALRSAMIVPIVARDRALGAITFVSAESSRIYTQGDLDRAQELASRAAFPIDNARLYQESRQVAQTLQKSFLPPGLPDVPGVDMSARYFAAEEGTLIGGDFYDAFRIDAKRWGVVLGDVSGKGLEAATVTTLARHTMRGAALTADEPSDALHVLNTALLEQQQTDRFCTAVYGIIEPRFARVRVTVSSGGHPPPYVIRNDGLVEPVDCGGTLLGFMEAVALRDATVELEFGDKLFLYTDGVLDIRQKGGMFGQEGLEKLLYECSKRGTEPAAEFLATSIAELQGGKRTDDVAFILVGVRSSVFNIRQRRGGIIEETDDDRGNAQPT